MTPLNRISTRTDVANTALGALLVFAGSYLGAWVGTLATYPQIGAAILFPPYAVLAAALILSPVRRWWILILASSLGNFWPHFSREGITSFVLMAETANVTRALVAAIGVRWFARQSRLFETLSDMVVFLGSAVIAGPAVGALIGAGAVLWRQPDANFFSAWQAWLLSNALTGLTLLPLILILVTRSRRLLAPIAPARLVEALILSIAMLAVGVYTYTQPHTDAIFPLSLYAPLPLLIWAAMRFGTSGMIIALSALSGITVGCAVLGHGPFSGHDPSQDLLQLQYFLIVICVPLLLLAALMTERQRTANALSISEHEATRRLALLSSIYESAPVGIAFVDTDLRFVRINECLAAYHGRTPAEVEGRMLTEVLPPGMVENAMAAQRQVLTTGQAIVGGEFCAAMFHDAPARHWMASLHPVRDDAGAIIGITTVVQDITQLKRAQEELRQSEERYREIIESQTELVCRYLPDTTLTFVNEAYCRYFGRTREELIGHSLLELVPAEVQREALLHIKSLVARPRSESIEHKVYKADGTIGWQHWIDHAIQGPDGQVAELQGIGRDITDRVMAEESLRASEMALRESYLRIQDLAGKLIVAQETERTRIARELHDGVHQQLAALSIGLSSIRRKLAETSEVQEVDLSALQQETIQLAEDVRAISHDLHPGVLQHAGLAPALRSRCEEFGRQNAIQMTFENDDASEGTVPSEISLCVYRITQEALQNIARHSGAKHVYVNLRCAQDQLSLKIRDDGRGFDPSLARSNGGLGLLSIEERVRLIHGVAKIESGGSRNGTDLCIEVPLGELSDAATTGPVGRRSSDRD